MPCFDVPLLISEYYYLRQFIIVLLPLPYLLLLLLFFFFSSSFPSFFPPPATGNSLPTSVPESHFPAEGTASIMYPESSIRSHKISTHSMYFAQPCIRGGVTANANPPRKADVVIGCTVA